jgi:hypothetical protein
VGEEISPPDGVAKLIKTLRDMFSERNCTDPSPSVKCAPPVWKENGAPVPCVAIGVPRMVDAIPRLV